MKSKKCISQRVILLNRLDYIQHGMVTVESVLNFERFSTLLETAVAENKTGAAHSLLDFKGVTATGSGGEALTLKQRIALLHLEV